MTRSDRLRARSPRRRKRSERQSGESGRMSERSGIHPRTTSLCGFGGVEGLVSRSERLADEDEQGDKGSEGSVEVEAVS